MLRRFELARNVHRLLTAALLVLCLVPAWAQDTAATVIELMGQVSIERPGALGSSRAEYIALFSGNMVKPQQVIITGRDGYAKLQVSDGSTFEVFPESRVVFRGNPPNWKDLLDVYLGRVKVYIQKLNGNLPNHNRVTTPTAVISVRGTIFDVAIEDADDTTLVSLEEGEVWVRNRAQGGEVVLRPGEAVRVFKNQPLAKNSIDRGKVIQGVLRAGMQAIYEAIYRSRTGVPGGSAGSTGGTTTVGAGDHDKGSTGSGGTTTTPPPAPPAPPPPPPPPPQ